MLSRLGQWADRGIEIGWLAAVLIAPIYFNVYSSRVFEPDKISTLRTIVLLMLVAWIIKLGEGGWRAWRGTDDGRQTTDDRSHTSSAVGRRSSIVQGVAEAGTPSWLGFLRIPMMVAILVYALTYIISTIFTITPDAAIWGSYQREQGTYSQFSYMLLGIMVLANLRTLPQLNRLINFILLSSLPVALYGLAQAAHLDPLPWAGDTASRVSSSMGNAIFVAAWLIMVTPFALYRLITGINSALAARQAYAEPEDVDTEGARGRSTRRTRADGLPSYGWATVANSVGILIACMMFFYLILKMMAGLPYPDGRTWWLLPFGILVFGLACWWIEGLGKRTDDPTQTALILPVVGAAVFFTSLLALTLTWNISDAQTLAINIGFDGVGLLWTFFFTLLWASVCAGLYALSAQARTRGYAADGDRRLVRASLNAGYGVLLLVQLICIYLTQSRGPWLGLGVGIVTFMVALWLLGRRNNIDWMRRVGGIASAIVLVLVLFVGALNIPGSPLPGAFVNVPVLGRGIERLSTLTRTEDGTGKVRSLIWQGATQLIVSDPARSIIGWGPESMYVAYNRFYPPELAQVELRNATPDRSHNVEFDQLVTMGALGLLAYYFLVGTFFFFALRFVKRARNVTDQLFGVTLLAAIGSHFVEIQTGIQIASTWTYFYLIVGILVAYGYYMTGYLRPRTEAALVPEGETANGTSSHEPASALTEARPVAVGAGASASAGGRSTAPVASTSPPRGNGKSQIPAPPRSKTGQSRGPSSPVAGARRPSTQYGGSRFANQAQSDVEWTRNPVMLVVYAVLALVALVFTWMVNVATVQADTAFKQAQAYDNQQVYFEQKDQTGKVYPGSLTYYDEAIALQPNQDYYYLFEGRAYLQAAKAVDTEQFNRRLNKNWSTDAATALQEKAVEKLARLKISEQILTKAHELSLYNTDHYANLGRLYLYWTDPTGGNDPSKAPLAVQWMQQATEHTPGNAQLWDELAVAYSNNNQFNDGIAAVEHSRSLDITYANTPKIKGQLYENRAGTVRNRLIAGQPLPTDGETDYGKLVMSAAQAYSETIGTDPTQLVDSGYQAQVDFFINAAQPFTNSNSSLTQAQLTNVLTDTLTQGFKNDIARKEADLVTRVTERGEQVTGPQVDDALWQKLWADPAWTDVTADGTTEWTDPAIRADISRTAIDYYGMGLIYVAQGNKNEALAAYSHALAMLPSFAEAQTALQTLTSP
ncbi:MAG TPA: O-antigen ligase family protein [Chloroflexia bacterium]|nr:O-antigen ligase family protein [Chloroflexia bacterium]